MNTCLVSGQHLQDVVDEPGEIVDDRDGGLVLAKRRVLQKSLIDGREQQRRVGKELLSIFAREYRRGTGDSHDKVRRGTIGVGGTDEVDDRLFRCADKPCRAHDDLNDIHRPAGTLVQVDPEVAGEVVEDHVAAIERLQQQDLLDRLLSLARRRSEHQQAHQRCVSKSVTNARHLSGQSESAHVPANASCSLMTMVENWQRNESAGLRHATWSSGSHSEECVVGGARAVGIWGNVREADGGLLGLAQVRRDVARNLLELGRAQGDAFAEGRHEPPRSG